MSSDKLQKVLALKYNRGKGTSILITLIIISSPASPLLPLLPHRLSLQTVRVSRSRVCVLLSLFRLFNAAPPPVSIFTNLIQFLLPLQVFCTIFVEILSDIWTDTKRGSFFSFFPFSCFFLQVFLYFSF